MKYYLCNGYVPNLLAPSPEGSGYTESHLSGPRDGETVEQRARWIKQMGHTPPKFGETVFFRNKKYGRVSIFTYDLYRTFLLIVSRSQRKAYLLGNYIPEKGFQMVRYYGWYSNRTKGRRRKEVMLRPGDNSPGKEDSRDFTILDVSDYEPPRAPSKTWRELIKKVWEVDPLTCPQCGSEMRIISLIQEPNVIPRILEHLGLWMQDMGSRCKKPKPGYGSSCP